MAGFKVVIVSGTSALENGIQTKLKPIAQFIRGKR